MTHRDIFVAQFVAQFIAGGFDRRRIAHHVRDEFTTRERRDLEKIAKRTCEGVKLNAAA